MPENSIAIIPPKGYNNQKNYFIKAVRWIQSEAMTRGIEIKHALNDGKQRINGHYVDGYHEELDGWLRMGLLPPPREFCRHILSCRELKPESFKRCLHSVLRGVSL